MIKSIALFDIDNTIYDGFSYFGLLEKQVQEGILKDVVLKDATASMRRYKDNAQDYETTIVDLLDIYAEGLHGQAYARVLQSAKEFYAVNANFYPYVDHVLRGMRQSHDLVVVTGEPQFVAEAVRGRFGMQARHSTEFEIKDGVFTGGITGYLATRHEKHGAIKHLMQGHQAAYSFAFGDSEGDIEMLRAVQYPVCVNPSDGLRVIAREQGWTVAQPDEVADVVSGLLANPSLAK